MKGPSDWFTGAVRIDPLFPVRKPAAAAGNTVTFEPGARTAWHTHPLGQIIIVISGVGRAQREGRSLEERGLHVYRFVNGLAVEGRFHYEDQQAYDAFWS